VPLLDAFVSPLYLTSHIKCDLLPSIVEHLAHAVAGYEGYTAVDSDEDGFGTATVDGSQSHTHGVDLNLVSWVWTESGTTIGVGEVTDLTLPVGTHNVLLTVTDDGGNVDDEATTVTVKAGGFPVVTALSPDSGTLGGGDIVTISGTGFQNANSVKFGATTVTNFSIISATTIKVTSPNPGFTSSIPVPVSVITPVGESNSIMFTYNGSGSVAIKFDIKQLLDLSSFGSPSSLAFGPDEKLYVGSSKGKLAK